jgi:hypothetical protein
VKPGRRVFDVALQGKTVLRHVDVVREARGRKHSLVREVKDVRVTDTLTVTLAPAPGTPLPVTVLSGVETVMSDD